MNPDAVGFGHDQVHVQPSLPADPSQGGTQRGCLPQFGYTNSVISDRIYQCPKWTHTRGPDCRGTLGYDTALLEGMEYGDDGQFYLPLALEAQGKI